MKKDNALLRITLGAIGGIVGTAAIFSALAANKKLFPETDTSNSPTSDRRISGRNAVTIGMRDIDF